MWKDAGLHADILNDRPDEAKAGCCQLPQRKEKSQRPATSLSKHRVSAVVAQQTPVAIAEDFCDRLSPYLSEAAAEQSWVAEALTPALLPTGDQLGEHATHPNAGEAERRGPRPHHQAVLLS